MGIICSKGLTSNDYDNQRDIRSSKSSRRLVSSSRRDDVVVEVDGNGGSDGRVRLIAKPQENAGPGPRSFNEGKKRVLGDGPKKDFPVSRKLKEEEKNSKVYRMLNGIEGEHIAAGWPSWLASVAGEAIRGWVPRKADSFEKLDKIGQGTYSNVYRARDLETGKIVALKKVRFANMDPESVRFMAREIHILRSLSHSNIVKLEGLVTSRMSSSLYLIFEYMEHDLAGLAAIPGHKFTEPQVKCFMYQLLCGLDHCHTHGILHRDIKGSNLLVDNNGILRIADFGLATFFHPDQKNPLTSRVVTLWYRPPELLLGATDYGVSVDMWSAGCILAELLAGKPIMPGRTEVEQLHKIFKLCGSPSEEYWAKSKLPHATIFKPQHPYKRCVAETFKDFPPSALALLDVLLAIDPANRGTAVSALKSEFFTTKPLPCDPSSLPKYPPSKELDAKLRDEARRQRAAALKGHGSESGQRGSRESKAVPAPEANAEMRTSLKKWQVYSNSKSNSEKYSTPDDTSSGFPMEPRRGIAQNTLPYSGFQNSNALGFSRDKKTREEEKRTTSGRISGSFKISNSSEEKIQRSYGTQSSNTQAGGKGVKVDGQREIATHWSEQSFNGKYNQTDAAESSDKQEWAHHLLDRPTSSHKKNEKRNGKESTTGPRKHRIHYSGPLLPPGGNMEEMLKEHERQIQQAVRRARHDKVKPKKKYAEKDQLEALLYPTKNGSADIL